MALTSIWHQISISRIYKRNEIYITNHRKRNIRRLMKVVLHCKSAYSARWLIL